jgi:hypothetical protein
VAEARGARLVGAVYWRGQGAFACDAKARQRRDLFDGGRWQHGQAVPFDETGCKRPDKAFLHRAALDPANVKRGLMRNSIEVEQLHRDRGGEFLRRFEETDEKCGLDEVLD